MVGIGRGLVILQVTRDTGSRRQVEIAGYMALITLQFGVSARQGKTHRIVIEIRRLPRAGGMTLLTRLGKTQSCVVRIAGLLEIWEMATNAGRWSTRVLPAGVTGGAIQGGVHSGQSKARYLQVIKFGSQPGIDGMALLTLYGEIGSYVIRSRGLPKRVLVTGIALDRKSLKLSNSFALVAVGAVEPGVASN